MTDRGGTTPIVVTRAGRRECRVPLALALDQRVMHLGFRVWSLLEGKYADRVTREAYPSRRRLAKELDVSLSSLDRAIRNLRDTGWLRVTLRRDESGDLATSLFELLEPCGGGVSSPVTTPLVTGDETGVVTGDDRSHISTDPSLSTRPRAQTSARGSDPLPPVPASLHARLTGLLAGRVPDPDAALRDLYAETRRAWTEGEHSTDHADPDAFRFWLARFRERWPPTQTSTRSRRRRESNVPDAAETLRRYIEPYASSRVVPDAEATDRLLSELTGGRIAGGSRER